MPQPFGKMGVVTLSNNTPKLIPEDRLEIMTETLKAISHPFRFKIVNILMNGERTVSGLMEGLGTEQSITSQQLMKLRLSGVLKPRRDGNVVYYSIKNNAVRNIMASIIENS